MVNQIATSEMDGRTFITQLVSSLAWPVATVIVAMIFRRVLRAKVKDIKKIKHHDTEIEFEKELGIFSETAQPLEKAIESQSSGSSGDPYSGSSGSGSGSGSGGGYDLIDAEYSRVRQVLIELADSAPWAVIIDGWKRVESKLRLLMSNVGFDAPAGTVALIEEAKRSEMIGPTIYALLKQFYRLRNTAAHAKDSSISREQAMEYIDWTIKLISALDPTSPTRCI